MVQTIRCRVRCDTPHDHSLGTAEPQPCVSCRSGHEYLAGTRGMCRMQPSDLLKRVKVTPLCGLFRPSGRGAAGPYRWTCCTTRPGGRDALGDSSDQYPRACYAPFFVATGLVALAVALLGLALPSPAQAAPTHAWSATTVCVESHVGSSGACVARSAPGTSSTVGPTFVLEDSCTDYDAP